MTVLLQARGLTKRFGGITALDQVDIDVPQGSIHAVIGPNGSGKTTLFNVISGVYAPTAGTLTFAGWQAGRLTPERLADLGLARTFQNTRLFPSMTVLETVLVVLHRKDLAWRFSQDDMGRARDILAFVGLEALADTRASSLPQGRRRLLEIAKAVALEPKLVLLDEPHGGLNHTETARLVEIIREMRRRGLTILLIEHEMDVVMRLADEITVLNFGRRLACGDPPSVRADERVVEAYLGHAAAGGADPRPAVSPTVGPLLSVRDLTVRYGDIKAVHGLDLDVGAGEFVSLLGNNGAGKSTTLKAIARLASATGYVTFDGVSLLAQPTERLVGFGIALVPERRRLFGGLTVFENLKTGAYGRPRAYIDEAAEGVLDLFPSLRRLARSRAFSLSGGEQQMLAIGRALMSGPRLLMLDEPSLGLAPKIVDQVFATLVGVNTRGTAILLVEQNARMALAVSHRGYVLGSGRVVAEGPAAMLATDERVRDAYLGAPA